MSRSIDYGELSADEIRKLDAYGQVGLLSWLYDEIKRLSDLKIQAVLAHHEAKALARSDKSDAAKATVDRAEGLEKALTIEISCRSKQATILQTFMRTIPH